MKHFVFCAANIPENELEIMRAIQAISTLDDYWDMNATITGVYEGSEFTVNSNDGNNTSIYVEDDDIHRLIYSCMEFAREMTKLKLRQL